jgi:MFS family permease
VLAYLLAVTTTIVGAGRLGDIVGHRQVLLGGILLFSIASVLCSFAPTLTALIAARAMQGLGAAVLMALTVALVGSSVPKERTGRAMGLLGTMSAIGTALGPSLGGLLIAGAGWRSIFVVMGGLGILTFVLAYRCLPDTGRKAGSGREGFDVAGTILLALTLGAYALAVTVGQGRFDGFGLMLLLTASLGAGLFVAVEMRGTSPLLRPSAFRDAGLSAGLLTNALVSTVMMATLVVGPFFLSRGLGLDVAAVGTVMSVGPVISAISGIPAGRLVDRLGAPFMISAGLIAMAAGCLALSTLPGMLGVTGYLVAIAVLTPGYQLFQAANNTAVMSGVGPDRKGVVSGLLSLSRNLGLITGASVMGTVFAYAASTADLANAAPEAVSAGMRVAFAVATALIGLAVAVALAGRRLSTPRPVPRNAQ